jgi:hypothetical protein
MERFLNLASSGHAGALAQASWRTSDTAGSGREMLAENASLSGILSRVQSKLWIAGQAFFYGYDSPANIMI